MKLRSLVAIAGISVSGIVTIGASTPAQAVGILLTSDVGYTGPSLDLSPYANGVDNYSIPGSTKPLPGGITFSATTNAVLGQLSSYGIVGFDGYPGNGFIVNTPAYAGLNSGNGYMTFAFQAPVSSFGAFVNYAPCLSAYCLTLNWDKPTISTYNSAGALLSSFDLSALAPIATPGNSGGASNDPNDPRIQFNQFRFRGINEGSAVIASFRIGGAEIVATGNATGSYASVPEPFTIIGTLVGGTIAIRMRNKLKARNKA